MKKIFKILLAYYVLAFLAIILFVIGTIISDKMDQRYYDTNNWQKIMFSEIGTFRMPQEWIVTQDENIIYITDKPISEKDYQIFFIGEIRPYILVDNKFSFELLKHIEFGRDISFTALSNSAVYGEKICYINAKKETKYFLEILIDNNRLDLLALDNLVDEKTLIKIAKSYSLSARQYRKT